MNYAERVQIDELIDMAGCSILHAVENRRKVIARRLSEGKASPRAESQLAALLALPSGYLTNLQLERQAHREADAKLQKPLS